VNQLGLGIVHNPTMSRPRFGSVVALVALLLATAMFSAPAHASGGQSVDPRLFVLGDSVILGAQGAVAARLGASGWQVTQISSESQHTYDAPGVIDANAGAIGDVVVISLGTNDGITPVQFAGWIDGVMERLQDVDRVYWVNLRNFADWVPAANAEIAAAQDRWTNLRVINWDARATPDPGLVFGDGIHLTEAGANAYAELIGSTVDEYAGKSAPATTSTTTTTMPRRSSREPSTTTTVSSTVPQTTPLAADTSEDDGIVPLWILLTGVGTVVVVGLAVAFVRARRAQMSGRG